MKKAMLFLLLSLFLFVWLQGIDDHETIEKSFEAAGIETLKVSNVNGFIRVEEHDRAVIAIRAEKIAYQNGRLSNVEVRFIERGSRLEVRAHRRIKNPRVKVNYTIKVPQGLGEMDMESVNGPIKITASANRLDAHTVNGSIDYKGMFAGGSFDTVNGSITLISPTPLRGDLTAKTVNGGIQAEWPADTDFSLEGSTLNGRIRCDWDLTVKKMFVLSKVYGRKGEGRHSVRIKTINGNITLLKI